MPKPPETQRISQEQQWWAAGHHSLRRLHRLDGPAVVIGGQRREWPRQHVGAMTTWLINGKSIRSCGLQVKEGRLVWFWEDRADA